MEDALAPSLLAAVRIMAREGTLDARLSALASEASAVSGGVAAVTLLRDVETGRFALSDGAAVELDAPSLAALEDVVAERRAVWEMQLPQGLAALVGTDRCSIVPLVVTDGVGPVTQGLLLVGGGRAVATESMRDVLLALADLAAIAIDQERLRAALVENGAWQERIARTDPLTGLADRRTFLQMLELEVVRAARQGTALAVVLFGVDDLQAISREHGGRVADDILRVVSATLAEAVRLVDTVARTGPDELGVIAPGDPTGMVARRVCDAVATLPAIDGVVPGIRAGVAHHPRDGTSPADLLRVAADATALARVGEAGSVVGMRGLEDLEVGPTA
jgi:diguanylate cyclase (GGDEF)-like protein